MHYRSLSFWSSPLCSTSIIMITIRQSDYGCTLRVQNPTNLPYTFNTFPASHTCLHQPSLPVFRCGNHRKKHNPKWFNIVSDGVFIVTGAQLVTKGRWLSSRTSLIVLSSELSGPTQPPSHSHKGSFFTSFSAALASTLTHHESHCLQRDESAKLNSAVFDDGPPVFAVTEIPKICGLD